MKRYAKLIQQSEKTFKRQTGISVSHFHKLVQAIRQYISSLKKENPLKNRGLNSALCLEDQLLLTLYYIRHYPIFLLLGQVFNISESYANKIYHKISNIVIKIAKINAFFCVLGNGNFAIFKQLKIMLRTFACMHTQNFQGFSINN